MEQFDGDAPRNHLEAEARDEKKNHRKDKPWDNEDIDHWKIDPWQDEIQDEKNAEKKIKIKQGHEISELCRSTTTVDRH